MRKYPFILLAVFLTGKSLAAQTTDSTVNALLAINEAQYLNKPLDSIIAVLPPGYTRMRVYGIRTTARKISVMYPNDVLIELHVRSFTHMNPVDSNGIWDLTLMRKENLYQTVIYKFNTCYRNCPGY